MMKHTESGNTCTDNVRNSHVPSAGVLASKTAGKCLRRADLAPSVIARFHLKYERSTPDRCWNWTGAKTSAGYGVVGIICQHRYQVVRPAHRVAYALANGEAPAGLVVMHACDNPLCVNPAHLSIGTHADNAQDCIRKGRRNRKPKTAA